MIQDLWGTFPRLIERNINGLLDGAMPNPIKAFHLYKTCKNEDLWSGSFETFSRHLEDFFSRPKSQRRKSHFDCFLDRPMDQVVFGSFHLNFRTALVSEKSLLDLASWAHHLMRVSKKSVSAVISLDVMTQTLRTITTPGPHDKAENIEFDDFCSAWKKTVFKFFGKQHDSELGEILKELQWINSELKASEAVSIGMSFPTIDLTQTEIDWVLAVRRAAEGNLEAPKFPLSRGPRKQALVDLERVASLYNVVRVTRLPELIKHRENIRVTIFDRCEKLVRIDKAAA